MSSEPPKPGFGSGLAVRCDDGKATIAKKGAMARFFLKHLLFLCLTLLVVSFIVFVLTEFTPGDVARKVLGAYATQEQVALLTTKMGLDRPVLVRYVEYVDHLAHGDLGYSTRFKVPVKDIIFDRLANTGMLAAIAFAIIVPLSMLLGIAAGMREILAARPRHHARSAR